MGLTGLIAVIIPDTPDSVKIQIQREKLLAREVLFEAESDGKDKIQKFFEISRIIFKKKSNFFLQIFFGITKKTRSARGEYDYDDKQKTAGPNNAADMNIWIL
jgi:hypothetical protein